ncbi:olfactory receptor 14J1-like, partial [Melospiza melodia melodia]|uniref:olfactory receptor 14J1-like n=1 Tax=Melospiza melodia melodia TaxID=1914991 RepID=UPI002FD48297
AAQLFMVLFFISTEFSLLTIMCYDRYVSICKPLHYRTLLGSRACAHMAAAAWASAFLNALMHTANTFSLPLCHGKVVGQFFCEVPQILKLSCSHSNFRKIWISLLGVCLGFSCFVFIVYSYVQIFRAVLRIPSEQGRHKAFSTCLPQLVVVSLFLSTATFAYLKPSSISSPSLDLAVSVLYSVVPPALNPLIYSLRNQDLKLSRTPRSTEGETGHRGRCYRGNLSGMVRAQTNSRFQAVSDADTEDRVSDSGRTAGAAPGQPETLGEGITLGVVAAAGCSEGPAVRRPVETAGGPEGLERTPPPLSQKLETCRRHLATQQAQEALFLHSQTQAGKLVRPWAGLPGEAETGSPGVAAAPAGRVLEADAG